MGNNPGLTPQPKSLADILAEELDGQIGQGETQELPVAEKQPRLRAVYDRIHAEQPERSALCLSGGGIRSAIFSLGVLQGLARKSLLQDFDYLSTVSGGGYVGGWLTAWIKNHPQGMNGVVQELQRHPDLTLNPEPEPIRHLRSFSNYLTPRTGLTSIDTWTLIATYIRNMFLNWLIIVSCLAAPMIIPRLYLAAILLPPAGWTSSPDYPRIVQRYDIALTALLTVSFVLVAVAMAYAIIDVPATGNAGFPQKRFLTFRQIPLLIAALTLTEWWALFCNVHGGRALDSNSGLAWFIAFAVATYLAGGLLGTVFLWFRRRTVRPHNLAASTLRLGVILITTGFGGFCLWEIATSIFLDPATGALNYVCFAPALVLAVLLLVNFLFTGLASWVSKDQDREWWARSAAWILVTICAWILLNGVVLWGAQAISADPSNRLLVFFGALDSRNALHFFDPLLRRLFAAFGGVTGVVAALLALRSKFVAKRGDGDSLQWVLGIVAVLFFLLLSLAISWLLLFISLRPPKYALVFSHTPYQFQLFVIFFLISANLLFGIVMGFFINVNKFSLHATYRNRLIRAFLGASRKSGERRPHLFTGFDPNDNIKLRDLKPGKPFHVINLTLNLVKGEQLSWQERRAESFTMSRLHCGSWHVGYRPSTEYGEGVSLGTALTISGAAASPNMGYHSSPLVGFLMTLFNVRLGCWLGNPGAPGDRTWRRSGPRYAVGPLFSEALGNTTDRYRYVNLSDGGHFENLGLYEMVLRRCRFILAIDAGQDFDYVFEDLGNAIRKIRIDLGIPIEIKVVSPKKAGGVIPRCAFGTIRYSAVDQATSDGSLIYIKPTIFGDEPPDVFNYAAAHPEFPHEPTTDQWFSESQLESYRLLGLHAVESICGEGFTPKDLPLFFAQVKEELARVQTGTV
ncbi:MAG: patatin-like phospholipase family protein [Chthoniobacterales bacterium]